MNAKKQKGSLLVSVLLFLTMASLVVTITLHASLLQIRMSQGFKIKNALLQEAELGLKQASLQEPANNLPCRLRVQNETFFVNKSKAWWLSSAVCQMAIQDSTVSYVVEDLPTDACLHIGTQGVALFRMTVFALSQNKKQHVLLQATYAQPRLQILNCEDQIQKLQAGRLSWVLL